MIWRLEAKFEFNWCDNDNKYKVIMKRKENNKQILKYWNRIHSKWDENTWKLSDNDKKDK